MSTDSNPSDAAQAGKELQDPKTMSEQNEPRPAAEQIENYHDMNATQTGMSRWTVTNRAESTAYQVRIGGEDGIACDCPDHKYTPAEDEFDACKHVLYVGNVSPRTMDSDVWSIQQLAGIHRDVSQAAADAKAAVEGMDATLVRTREAVAEGPEEAATASVTYDTDELEGKLYTALEEAGFNVHETGQGMFEGTDQITFEAGHDDFDRLKAVTSECDMVGYDGDHNAINVDDVEQYIEEVL